MSGRHVLTLRLATPDGEAVEVMAREVDLAKPDEYHLVLNETGRALTRELLQRGWLQTACVVCGGLGHQWDTCPQLTVPTEPEERER